MFIETIPRFEDTLYIARVAIPVRFLPPPLGEKKERKRERSGVKFRVEFRRKVLVDLRDYGIGTVIEEDRSWTIGYYSIRFGRRFTVSLPIYLAKWISFDRTGSEVMPEARSNKKYFT